MPLPHARSVPYTLRDLMDKELERLQGKGTLKPVEIFDWLYQL